MSFAYEATYLRRHFLLMSREIFSYVCRRDISISSIQRERMYMGGKLPVFRLIQQPGRVSVVILLTWLLPRSNDATVSLRKKNDAADAEICRSSLHSRSRRRQIWRI